MSDQGKKRGPKPKLWKLAKLGKKFASAVLYFKFGDHPAREGHPVRVRGHAAAIRRVLKLPEFAYLKRYTIRYLEKKFQEALAFWYPPHPQYPHPKANRANYRNKRIRGTDSELKEHNRKPQAFS